MANPTGREWIMMWQDAERLFRAVEAGDHEDTALSQLQGRLESSIEAWARMATGNQLFIFTPDKGKGRIAYRAKGVLKLFDPLSEEPRRVIQLTAVFGGSDGSSINRTFARFYKEFLAPRFESKEVSVSQCPTVARFEYHSSCGQSVSTFLRGAIGMGVVYSVDGNGALDIRFPVATGEVVKLLVFINYSERSIPMTFDLIVDGITEHGRRDAELKLAEAMEVVPPALRKPKAEHPAPQRQSSA